MDQRHTWEAQELVIMEQVGLMEGTLLLLEEELVEHQRVGMVGPEVDARLEDRETIVVLALMEGLLLPQAQPMESEF